ncbi:hypothetical protein K402DRAFT_396522 [Aulographum hederae CBS 113979]|uniref:Cora-domain-containing protein n=1 Tax=Aulographum hederae CBS 113979 TaxID=1176131 RepID=A0A6G1GRC1_9PEZI|nr:hypothetical protein K402DRAFT_396522 [Aulographum hederae CBS 113979]
MATEAPTDGGQPAGGQGQGQGHRRSESAPPITVEDHSTPHPEPNNTDTTDGTPDPTANHHQNRARSTRRARRRGSPKRSKKQQHHSPGVEWRETWTAATFKLGRVLLIDYISREFSSDGRRKVYAQEFHNLQSLKEYYADPPYRCPRALRLIHVQNAPWARKFLLRKFNIHHTDDLVGTTFGKWAQFDRPQRRGGKPILNGKSFRVHRDPWRGVSRAGFGMDYLKHYDATGLEGNADYKMMGLNNYDAQDSPAHLYDVYVQRLSVYIQHNEGPTKVPDDSEVQNPYIDQQRTRSNRSPQLGGYHPKNGDDYVPILHTLDNGSAVIVFEDAQSGSCIDTLIGAREEIETRWRRLTFFLPEASNDDRLALECMDLILRDIFKGLANAWDMWLKKGQVHVSILEDKIFENPADESRAPELWTNSSQWLKVEKLGMVHLNIIRELQGQLKEMTGDHEDWLSSVPPEYEKIANLVQEDLVKPTAALGDLMYKSVGIRDSRDSLRLGTSMWRLSWITFIFLPLTFIVGFFGMNVDTFDPSPSIKWYFIVSVPLMVLILVLWYLLKHVLARHRQDPLRRGVYERLFQDLATRYPQVWSRNGPREHIEPVGWVSRVKWRLLKRWFASERTINASARGEDRIDELGAWAAFKRRLVRRWLPGISLAPGSTVAADLGESGAGDEFSAMTELLALSTPVALGVAGPESAVGVGERLGTLNWSGRVSEESGGSGDRGKRIESAERRGSAGVMVETEEKPGSEDEGNRPGSSRSSDGGASRLNLLNVPLGMTGSMYVGVR